MILEIFIITYNRAAKLDATLTSFVGSILSNFSISVLDNCSTDSTYEICSKFISVFPQFRYNKNKINVGANANILRAIELSNADYTWVVCDDDILDLSEFEDVLQVLESKKVDLIHVGGHEEKSWAMGGKLETPKKLMNKGYPYFKFSSFLPSNIFRTELFQKKYIIAGYNNVGNAYPHMPYLFAMYYIDAPIYVSKKQIITAVVGGQSYSSYEWFLWWMKTCELMANSNDVKLALFDQWNGMQENGRKKAFSDFYNFYITNKGNDYIQYFIRKYFSDSEKFFLKSTRVKYASKKVLRIFGKNK